MTTSTRREERDDRSTWGYPVRSLDGFCERESRIVRFMDDDCRYNDYDFGNLQMIISSRFNGLFPL